MSKSQHEMVLNHLEAGLSITPLEALNSYGCFRLSAIIYDLKKLGHNIETEMVSNGRKHFAKYTLIKVGQQREMFK